MIIIEVRNQVAPERSLVQDYEMVETLSSNRADQPFEVWTLPWRTECGEHFVDFQSSSLRPESGTIDAVTIPEQEPRSLTPGKCLQDLGCGPLSGRMFGDAAMHNAPAIMSQNKKHVQDPETDGGHDKEINGNQLFDVIFQERPPCLGRRLPMLQPIFRNLSLRNIDSELEKFRVDSWCSPQDIGGTHVLNQLPDFPGNSGAANSRPMTFPPPVESKSSSMPGDHGVRLDEQKAISPSGPEAGEKDPQDSIRRAEPNPFLIASVQDDELVPKGGDFQL